MEVISPLTFRWGVASSRWLRFSGSVTLPPARKAPRTKASMLPGSSSTPKLMWWLRAASISPPKASKILLSFSRSVTVKLRLPPSFSGETRSKLDPKARRHSRGSRSAKAALAVMIRSSRGEKLLQYISTP